MDSSLDAGADREDLDDRGLDAGLDVSFEDAIDVGTDAGADVPDGAFFDSGDVEHDAGTIVVADASQHADAAPDTGQQDAGTSTDDAGLPDPCEAINNRTDIACLKNVLGCFDGSGNCKTTVSGVLEISSVSTWENGSSVELTFVDEQKTTGKVVSSDGDICFTFNDLADPSGETTTTYHAGAKSVKVLIRNDGSTQVTCDDGKVVELSTDLNPDLCLPNVYSFVAVCSMD